MTPQEKHRGGGEGDKYAAYVIISAAEMRALLPPGNAEMLPRTMKYQSREMAAAHSGTHLYTTATKYEMKASESYSALSTRRATRWPSAAARREGEGVDCAIDLMAFASHGILWQPTSGAAEACAETGEAGGRARAAANEAGDLLARR